MKKDNVIDLNERIQQPHPSERMKKLKVRFDLEHAKIAVSTSLLSIVILVTLANNSMLGGKVEASSVNSSSRGIASVQTGTSAEEDSLVQRLSQKELTASAALGRKPSDLEKLTLGFLEGKYAVQLENGKLSHLQFSLAAATPDQSPKHVEDLAAFIESNRGLLPVSFAKTVKVESKKDGEQRQETFQLVNKLSMPVAKVQFMMDASGRLLSMHVDQVVATAN